MTSPLTSEPYSNMKDGPCRYVTGELLAGGYRWHVSVFLRQQPDGTWRIGRPGDSETYVLNHVQASIPARYGPHRVASTCVRRELLTQIYDWINQACGHVPPRSIQDGAARSVEGTMQCSIFTKYGKGPRCSKIAPEGQDICKTHKFLESKLGALPRAAVVEVAPVESPVSAPVETPISATEPDNGTEPVKVRKIRSDKGKRRSK